MSEVKKEKPKLKKTKSKIDFQKNILVNRYTSSRWIFILATLVFFTNYLFVGGEFLYDISITILPYTYCVFIVSFLFYVFFTCKKMFSGKLPRFGFYIVFLVLLVIFSASLVPFIIKL